MAVGNVTMPSEVFDSCEGLIYCMASWANIVTNGLFWVFALASASIIGMIATSRLGSARAFGFGGFIALTGAVWLAMMDLIAWWIASLFIIIGLISLAGLILNEK